MKNMISNMKNDEKYVSNVSTQFNIFVQSQMSRFITNELQCI